MAEALRLRLNSAGAVIRLRSSRKVQTSVPPCDAPAVVGEAGGFWVEVRDSQNRTLYRRVLPDPLQDTIEVFPERSDDRIVRHRSANRQVEFFVIIPNLEGADSAVFFGSRYEAGRRLGFAKEISRVKLNETDTRK